MDKPHAKTWAEKYGGSDKFTIRTIEQLNEFLKDSTPEEVFSTYDDRVESIYTKYAKLCHPDSVDHTLAVETFKLLTDKREARLNGKFVKITAKLGTYEVSEKPIFKGDIADFYLTKDKKHLLKIGRTQKSKDLFSNEHKVLKAINSEVTLNSKMQHYYHFISNSFAIDGGGSDRSCHVFEYNPELYSLVQVHEKYPDLDPRHWAWMFKRILVSLAWTHKQGYVHGAVLPEHILVNRETHGAKLIGWSHSVKVGEVITSIPGGEKDQYPQSVIDKQPATPEIDLYMVGQLGKWMLGNQLQENSNSQIRSYLRAFSLPKAKLPGGAWDFHVLLDEILQRMYGKPKFVNLEM